MFLFGNSSPDGTTREGNLGEEYAGVPTIRAKRLARLQLGTLAAALSAEPKVLDKKSTPTVFRVKLAKSLFVQLICCLHITVLRQHRETVDKYEAEFDHQVNNYFCSHLDVCNK